MGKTRRYLWDNLKFVLIFCVVIGHYIQYYTDDSANMRSLFVFLYTFHMPAFIFVSGLFSKRIINEKRWSKVFDYFVMYVFIKIILCISDRINGGNRQFWLLSADSIEWYAFAIMAFLIITILLRNYNPKYILVFSVIIGCLSGYHSENSDFLCIQRILVFFPFFYLGYLMNPEKIEKFTRKKWIKIISIIFLLAVVIVYIRYGGSKLYDFRPLFTGRNPYSSLDQFEALGGFLRGGYYIGVLIMIFAIISLMPIRKTIFSKWGSHTLSVYVLHRAVIYFFMGVMGGNIFIDTYEPHNPGIMLIPIAFITTVVLSLPVWDRILDPILHPKMKSINK